MFINDSFILSDRLKELEVLTLKFFITSKLISRSFSEIRYDAAKSWGRDQKDKNTIIDFNTIFHTKKDKRNIRVHFGGRVLSKKPSRYCEYSYFFAYYDNDKKCFLRKFHFDYNPSYIETKGRYPIFHLQYCGKFSDEFNVKYSCSNSEIDHLDPWFSEPRINNQPMSLAILFSFILMDCSDDSQCKSLVEDPSWRKILKENERCLIHPFCENLSDFIDKNNSSNSTLSDYYYGI